MTESTDAEIVELCRKLEHAANTAMIAREVELAMLLHRAVELLRRLNEPK